MIEDVFAAAAQDLGLEERMVVEMGNDALSRRTCRVVDTGPERHSHASYFHIPDDLQDVRILILDDSLSESFVGLVNAIGRGYHEDVGIVQGILNVVEYLDES